ncbi:hypothetical protein F5876DRAFT_64912 [Lentinula aff. lateritia]|uniref:Uncharacterized protein n=1 Tax=Lentinula aff. lateritia TaxID=2804960 RepID=A0ACC1U2W0_9AGAR|nr:hypothetical protein F5876DRAFT_64912 [Lentinula aff. lateritia]
MSLSVDDLVSSLSSSHIGQEALDLAALQAQLAQTLFPQPIASSSDSSLDSFHQPCNTPTGRTPSSSFSWGQVMDVQQHLSRRDEMIDDTEDERMVEDILMPSSPASAGYSSAQYAVQQQMNSPFQKSHNRNPHNRSTSSFTASPSPSSVSESSSSFTSTDPFYLAQLQAMQSHNAPSPSAMSQLGMPAQHSPFAQQQQTRISFPPASISLDTHNLFAVTSVAFEC